MIDLTGFYLKIKKLKKFTDTAEDIKIRKALAKYATELIFKRVKTGFGAVLGRKTKLAPLSSSYVRMRKSLAGSGGTRVEFIAKGEVVSFKISKPVTIGEFMRPRKSNLTMTGQMLKAMTYKVTPRGFKIYIESTSRDGDNLSNKQVARLAAVKRPFMSLTSQEIEKIRKQHITMLRALARGSF